MRKKIESQKCSYVKAKNKNLKKTLTVRNSYRNFRKKVKVEKLNLTRENKNLKKPLTVRNSYRNLRKKVKVEIQKYRSND